MIIDDPVLREAAGLPPNCMHYPDQRCEEIIFTGKHENPKS